MSKTTPTTSARDINGGAQDLRQLFTRPVPRLVPYSTPVKGLYLCSSSTPPGGGVHGMCGYYAARAAFAARIELGLLHCGGESDGRQNSGIIKLAKIAFSVQNHV